LRTPAATNGVPSHRFARAYPASDGLTDDETVRVALVRPAAAVRSRSSTIDMTYDCLAGTSICDKD